MKDLLLFIGFGILSLVIGALSAVIYLSRSLRPTVAESAPIHLGTRLESVGEFSSSRFLQNH